MNAYANKIAPADATVPDLAEMEDAVRAIWKDVLGDEAPEEIGADDDFFDIGGTSLSLIAVVTKLSQHFGTDLPTSIVTDGATVNALAKSALDVIAGQKS